MKNFLKNLVNKANPFKKKVTQTIKNIEIPKPEPRKPRFKKSDYKYLIVPINRKGKIMCCNFKKQQLPGKILIEGKQRFVIELNELTKKLWKRRLIRT